MKTWLTSLAVIPGLVISSRAAADLAPVSRHELVSRACCAAPAPAAAPESAATLPVPDDLFKSPLDGTAAPLSAKAEAPTLDAVPPLPGSASLFVSAMLSLGAWHAARAARQWYAVVPDWYHAEGARQVGHATAFDLAFQPAAAVVVRVEPASPWRPADLRDARLPRQSLPIPSFIPRGPPARA